MSGDYSQNQSQDEDEDFEKEYALNEDPERENFESAANNTVFKQTIQAETEGGLVDQHGIPMTAQGDKHNKLAHNASRQLLNITKADRITGKSKMMVTGAVLRTTIQASTLDREES